MTRPPDPPRPGWGQSQPGPYPQQWGAPAPGGYPPHGGYPPPPKPNRKPLWIALGALGVVVVALLVTGFVAPGFFLGKDTGAPAPAPSPAAPPPAPPATAPSSSAGTTSGGEEFAVPIKAFLDAVNSGDQEGAMKSVCTSDTVLVRSRLTKIFATGKPQFETVALGLVTRGFSNAYLGGTLNGQPLPETKDDDGVPVPKGTIGSNNVSGKWCVDGIRTGIPAIDGD